MAVVLVLPFGDGVLEELLEGEWAGELIGGAEDDVGHVAEFVEDVNDVVVMELAEECMMMLKNSLPTSRRVPPG